MKKTLIIFPIHLFKTIPHGYDVIIVEDQRFFTDFRYHKMKLAYHRATMKYYEHYLGKHKVSVKYYEDVTDVFYQKLTTKKDKSFYYYETFDTSVESRMKKYGFTKLKTPNFLCPPPGKRYKNFMEFYKAQRRRLNLLLVSGKPKGGKWTYDTQNRKKLPKELKFKPPSKISNKYVREAIHYVSKKFPHNYGSLDNFIFPTTHRDAKKWLITFLKKKLKYFGKYEDAISTKTNFAYHSMLSPMMNIGLLTDQEVIKELVKYESKVPIQSYEGFLRQIIGWRNYCVYVWANIKSSNQLKATKPLPYKKFWTATTGITHVDDAIKNIIKYGYTHHIVRLMVLGNYMLLCGYKPTDVYTIFMEWFVDSYEVFMKMNVYAMSQYSMKLLTRPYFSSANYILKMSNYSKHDSWVPKFNLLFRNFVCKHRKILRKNYSYAGIVASIDKAGAHCHHNQVE